MGIDSFSEVTTQSWGSRIKGSLSGIFFGLILVVVACVLLFWNEGRAVKRAQALDEGASSVVSVSSNEVDPANNEKLVHLTGVIHTTATLSDSVFPVQKQAVKLKRKAEMYQWEEKKETTTKEKTGGKKETTTTYSYQKTWSSSLLDSTGFKKQSGHENPGNMPYRSETWSASDVQVDAFQLNETQIGELGNFQNLPLPPDFIADLPPETTDATGAQITGDTLYLGYDPTSPRIGDVRISFSWVPPGDTVSIIAKQKGSSFVPYVAKSGSSIDLLVSGGKTAEEMFASERQSNTILTWILRFAGFFMMFLGFRTMMNIARTLAAVVPFIANMVGFGLSLISGLLAMVLSLTTIAIAWFVYRPMLSVILIAVMVGILLAVRKFKKAKPQNAFVPPPPS